jgi:hypothetical protein
MPNTHVVQEGECLLHIGLRYGFDTDSFKDVSGNRELFLNHRTPYILNPGDIVYLPEKNKCLFYCKSGQREELDLPQNAFPLRMKLLNKFGVYRPFCKITVELNNTTKEMISDENGIIVIEMPLSIPQVGLIINDYRYTLRLSYLVPVSEVKGVQQRLAALGYYYGAIDGAPNPDFLEALKLFQAQHCISLTGVVDKATIQKFKEYVDCKRKS